MCVLFFFKLCFSFFFVQAYGTGLRWHSGVEFACLYRRLKRRGFDAWFGKNTWRRSW